MAKYMKILQKEFSTKERTEELLSNLDKLEKDGSIADDQYHSMKTGYTRTLNEAISEIEYVRKGITRDHENEKRALETYKQELCNLEARFKVGEIPVDVYQKSEQRTRRKIEKIETKISELEKLHNSKSTEDVGGYLYKTKRRSLTIGRGFSLGNIFPSINQALPSDFTEFIPSFGDITTPRTRLIGLVGGILMLISAFLPWASISILGTSQVSAFDISGALGTLSIVAGLICVVAAFLEYGNARGMLHTGMGVIALLMLASICISSLSVPDDYVPSLGGEIMEKIAEKIMDSITIREGFYLYIISSIAVIVGGIFELRE